MTQNIVKLAGTFTSPHVYPQALLLDQKVCMMMMMMMMRLETAVTYDCYGILSKHQEDQLKYEGGGGEYQLSGRVDCECEKPKRWKTCHPRPSLQVPVNISIRI